MRDPREHRRGGGVDGGASVAVDTRNPPGHERPIAELVRAALERWRPAWTEIEPAAGRLSLIAALPHPDGPGDRPTLIINGHLDVVPVTTAAWTRDPFDPHVENGRLYGRGSADMKGGIAAAICALSVLERAGRTARPATSCSIWWPTRSAVARLGTQALLERGLIDGDACLVPDPTDMQLCVAERGLLRATLTVHGRPGHGSRPREAVSAIEHAASVVLALHAADFGDPDHPLLGQPTANVGTINGGDTFNTVAESCVIGVDRRVLPGVTEGTAEAEVRARIAAAGVEGLSYDLEVDTFGEASEMPADDPWVKQVGAAVAAATRSRQPGNHRHELHHRRPLRPQSGENSSPWSAVRAQSEQAHGNDEWVSVERLVDATAAYAELLAEFG